MAAGLRLKSVQKGKGRIHLTPAVRPGEPVRTLCGKELPAGSAREVDAEADCTLCRRRSRDPAAVSSAFFEQGEGERVLELALAKARSRPPRAEPTTRPKTKPAAAPKPAPMPPPEPEPAPPRRLGELDAGGLREFSDNVYLAPGGVIVRIDGGRVVEVVGEGGFQLLRRGRRLLLRAGGLRLEAEVSDLAAGPDQEGR